MCGGVTSARCVVYGGWCSEMYSAAEVCALAVDVECTYGIGAFRDVQSVMTA